MHQSWIFQEKAIKQCRRSSGMLGFGSCNAEPYAKDSLPSPGSQVNLYHSLCIVQVPMFQSDVAQVYGLSFGRTTSDAIPPASIPAPCTPHSPSSQHSSLMHANTHTNTTANTPTTIVPPSLHQSYTQLTNPNPNPNTNSNRSRHPEWIGHARPEPGEP